MFLYAVYSFDCSATFREMADFFAFCTFLSSCRAFMLSAPVRYSASVTIQLFEFCRIVRWFFGAFYLLLRYRSFFSSSVSGESFDFSYMYSGNSSVNASTDMSLLSDRCSFCFEFASSFDCQYTFPDSCRGLSVFSFQLKKIDSTMVDVSFRGEM